MKLEEIINIVNEVFNKKFIIIRRSESSCSFAPGIKKQWISILENNVEKYKSEINSIKDVSNDLEYDIVFKLMEDMKDGTITI